MDVHQFLDVLLLILVAARLFAEITARLDSLSVMRELLAGVVLGPILLGRIEPYDAIRILAETGIILLLFEVGLVFAELGREAGVFDKDIYAGMVMVIAFTTLLPPLLLKWIYVRHGAALARDGDSG